MPNQTPQTPEELYPAPVTGEEGLSTPSAYATPHQLEAARLMAQSLMRHGQGGAQQEVHNWAQGLSNLANTFVGNMLMNKAARREQAQYEGRGQAWNPTGASQPGGGMNVPQPQNSGMVGLLSGVKKIFGGGDSMRVAGGPAPGGGSEPLPPNSSDMDHYERAIMGNEQDQRGSMTIGPPVWRPGRPGQPGHYDRAYGATQVMGDEIPGLTAKYVGHPMNIADFLHDKEAQRAVFRGEFGRLVAKHGPDGAARAWFAGEGGMNNPRASDGHWNVAQYSQHFRDNLARQGWKGPQPAVGQPPGATPPPSAQNAPAAAPGQTRVASNDPSSGITPWDRGLAAANVAAERGQFGAFVGEPHEPAASQQVAASQGGRSGVGGQAPGPSMAPRGAFTGGAQQPPTQIPAPELLPRRIPMSKEQLQDIMRNPLSTPEERQRAYEIYNLQFQPVEGVDRFGRKVIAPARPGTADPMTVTPIEHMPIEIEGAGKFPYFYTTGPNGEIINQPMGPGGVPGISAPAAPAAPPQRSILDDESDQPPPPEPGVGGKRGETAPPGALGTPPPVAEKTKGVQVASLDPSAGLGAAPPEVKPAESGAKVAQAGAPSFITPDIQKAIEYGTERKAITAGKVKAATSMADEATDYYKGVRTRAENAAFTERQQLDEMDRISKMPSFYSGFGSDLVLAAKRLAAATGMGDKRAAAAMETFEKIRNDLNLNSLKSRLGGLGQIRQMEIHMVDRAFANLNNSVAANQALIFLAKKINDRNQEAGKLSEQYVKAHGGVPDIGLQNRLINHYRKVPLMNDDEVKQFESLMDSEAKQSGSGPALGTKPPKNTAPPPPPGARVSPPQ